MHLAGSGLFTTGGHYIVLVANNNRIITVYDPYLYNGKFNTASRRNANAMVSGNSVFISEDSFKKYANYKNFWIYSNDNKSGNTNGTDTNVASNTVNYTRYVATQSANLNVRSAPNGSVKSSLKKGTAVTVTEVNGDWSRISGPIQGWVSSSYLSSTVVKNTTVQNTAGITKKLARASILYSNSNLTGKKYNYKANTTIKILKNISSTVDYVQVIKTGRKAYINNNNYATTVQSTSQKSTVGQYKRLKSRTTLYKNSNLNGTKYNYLANTQVKIIKNISSNIDYVYVVKTR